MKIYAVMSNEGADSHYEEFFSTEAAAKKWMDKVMPPADRHAYNAWWVEEIAVNEN